MSKGVLLSLLVAGTDLMVFAQPAPHVPPYPRTDDTVGYKVDVSWPREKPPGGEWSLMSSVAVAPNGNVWTFNRGKIPLQIFTPDGKLVAYWGQDGLFKNPHTVRFDRAGNPWLVDTGTHTVRKFTVDGKVLLTIGTPNEAGLDQTHMNQPNDVAFGANGDIYVSDGYGNDRIIVFDKAGKFVREWGKLGNGPGEFSQPHSVAVDSKGRVYVADRNNARIQIFDAKGKFLTEWRNVITPWALEITKTDEIYVCGSSPMLWSEVASTQSALSTPPKDQLFMKFDTEGRLKQLWVFPKGDKPGEVSWVHSMALAGDGSLYLAEVQGRRAEKFIPAGAPLKSASR